MSYTFHNISYQFSVLTLFVWAINQWQPLNLIEKLLCYFQYQQGLIQMSILPRLRYILEVCCPGAPTVQDVLDVLTRVAQHSTQSANEVLRCPRLMEAIFANFLPLSWNAFELKSGIVYGQPVAVAMRLARAVCCAGRHMAATLVSWTTHVSMLCRTESFLSYNHSRNL